MIKAEIFKEVKGYEGIYEVSNFGRVKSLARLDTMNRQLKERILKAATNSKGYKHVLLCIEGKTKTIYIHSLVAEAFLGYIRDGNINTGVVNHIDEDKLNNNVENLEVVSARENLIHSRTKRRASGLPANIKQRPNGRYAVQIFHGTKGDKCQWCLGTFNNVKEAVAARDDYFKMQDRLRDVVLVD